MQLADLDTSLTRPTRHNKFNLFFCANLKKIDKERAGVFKSATQRNSATQLNPARNKFRMKWPTNQSLRG